MRAVLMSRFTQFPERVPPFEPTSLVAGTDGRLYLRLAEPGLAARTVYHVIDRSGTHAEFSLVADARVVSASERFIYVVERDSLGLLDVVGDRERDRQQLRLGLYDGLRVRVRLGDVECIGVVDLERDKQLYYLVPRPHCAR